MASVSRDEEQRWVPTHVQVLVIRARGLRAKGKHGTSDAYVVVQLGKAKYSTCVMEKTRAPEWGEECSFELQPGVLEDGSRDMLPAGTCDLTLTVMHRALIGLDVFLGQAVIALDTAFRERACMRNEWFRLHSKTGKKEKERGELQLTVQFTRHNLTASMYDLSIKDKPRSAFIRLRERMRARKRCGDEESSSAIVPGGYGGQARIRGRLPSDGGGEEDYEDDEGGELRRSKMRSYFLHGRLRKSSDTRSSTSLGSESSESSSRGGSLSPTAGISVVVSDLSNSPSNSSNLTVDSPEHTVAPSPLVSPVRHVFNEVCDISIPVPHSLTSDGDAPILLPSVCVNGNPVETSPLTHQPPSLVLQQPKQQMQPDQEQTKTSSQTSPPEIDKPTLTQTSQSQPIPAPQTRQPKGKSKPKPEPHFPVVGLLQKGPALSLSMQNLSRHKDEQKGGGPLDGRRWSFDKPGEEEKAAIAAALENTGLVVDEPVEQTTVTVSEAEVQSKKKRGLFSTGKEETQPAEGKHRGWFSSKDSKPSPSKYQHEGPISNPSNPTPLLDFFQSGQSKKNQVDKAAQKVTKSTYKAGIPDEECITNSDSYTNWNDFIGESQKLHLKTKSQMITDFPPPLIKPTDPLPSCSQYVMALPSMDDSLMNLSNTTSPCTWIVENLKTTPFHPLESKANCVCWNTQNTDINFVPQDVSDFQFDLSLPHSTNIDFSEMNALACPYPALLNTTFNKDKLNTVSVCRVLPSAKLQLPTRSERSSLTDECLDLGFKSDWKVEHETVESRSSQKLVNDNSKECKDIYKTTPHFCKDFSSDGTLESSTIETSESSGRYLDIQNSKSFQTELSNEDNGIKSSEEEPVNKDKSCLDASLSAGIATDTLALQIPPRPNDSLLQDEVVKKKHAADNPECASLNGNEESFLTENLEDIMTSSPGVSNNIPVIQEQSNNLIPNPFKVSFKVDRLPSSISEDLEVETRHNGRMMLPLGFLHPHSANVTMETDGVLLNLNAALSPGCVASHSLYASANSEHYFTCMSENSSLSLSLLSQEPKPKCNTFEEDKPKSGSFLEDLPTNYLPLQSVTEPQHDPNELSEEALQKDKAVFTNDSLNQQASSISMTKCVTLGNTPEKCDLEYALTSSMTNEATLKCNIFVNKMLNSDLMQENTNTPQIMIARPEKLNPHFCLERNNISPTDPPLSQHGQLDCALEDLLAHNCVPHHSVVHTVGNSPLAHPGDTCKNVELLHDSSNNLQRNLNKLSTAAAMSNPQGSRLENSQHCYSTNKPPNPKACVIGHPTLASGHDLMTKYTSCLLDPSPLASSTPDVAVGTNGLPMSRLPIKLSAPANSSPYIVQAAAPVPSIQPLFSTLPASFSLAAHHVPMHLNSPHPVKPLTPPDEKRSEGRSVLEKLKSTINPGRSHHGDHEPEKKLLVEGGGSYYHLNHNELVSLLLQRDAELQQEREEYDRRGFLLEKREVEIKKMKAVIRDLEDYIDTLLVRIMEQTPALLQVRSKMK